MLVVALVCVASFYFEITEFSFSKQIIILWGIPSLTGQACSANDCLEQSSSADQPSAYDLTFSFFNCISCF